MNSCNECSPCGKKCKPARYARGFHDECDDKLQETDTTLSIDNSSATLNYNAERHTDEITGKQLGGLINLPDLRDVNIDYDFDAMCAEFIYHKYGECGDGCMSQEDSWNLFSIDQPGAKQNQIRYVRGANAYGCPVFLDVPSNTNQYWYAGWRPNGQFGYYQAANVPELPKDAAGNYIVMGQDPNTKQPIVGTIPSNLDCILNNLLSNFGVDNEIKFEIIKGTPKLQVDYINQATGAFSIQWNDWWDNFQTHVGTGHIVGKITWTYSFDANTGNMVYEVEDIYFDRVYYEPDKGVTTSAPPLFLSIWGIPIGGGEQVPVLTRREFTGRDKWNDKLNIHVRGSKTFTLTPGQSMGPFQFMHMYNDWVADFDDECYMTISFRNALNNWSAC